MAPAVFEGPFFLQIFQRAFAYKYCQNISPSIGMTKSRAFAYKSCQNIFPSVGMTKSRAFAYKCCQNISTSVEMTKSRAFAYKCCIVFGVILLLPKCSFNLKPKA